MDYFAHPYSNIFNCIWRNSLLLQQKVVSIQLHVTFAFLYIIAGKPSSFPIESALPPSVVLLRDCDHIALLKAQLK